MRALSLRSSVRALLSPTRVRAEAGITFAVVFVLCVVVVLVPASTHERGADVLRRFILELARNLVLLAPVGMCVLAFESREIGQRILSLVMSCAWSFFIYGVSWVSETFFGSKRWLTPILSRVGFVPQDAGHETSGPAADGALAGAAWASRLEPGGAVATLRAPDLEAALVAETLRADPRG